MFKYVRFLAGHVLVLVAMAGILAGGIWMWSGFVASLVCCIVGDALLGDDVAEPRYAYPSFFLVSMGSALPLMVALSLAFAWMLASGDPLGAGAWFGSWSGWDAFAAREATRGWHLLGGTLSVGLLYALSGTDIGHELVHRTHDRTSMLLGRWMLAFTWDSQFSIEHVYGHHQRLCTPRDPATARRGEIFHRFLLRSFAGQLASAWKLEAGRLRGSGLGVWSWRNRVLRGYAMSVAVTAGFFAVAGIKGALFFTAAALFGKSVLEVVNYFEHYGLVREEGRPVRPCHSWNSNKLMSNIILHNVTRHSNHHAQADVPFWELKACTDQPTLPHGYLTLLAIIYFAPGLYRRMMTPLLLDWDRRFASEAERELARRANAQSGLAGLMATAA
jgi:fatty acid desaturase